MSSRAAVSMRLTKLLCTLLGAIAALPRSGAAPADSSANRRQLFNRKDLTGWNHVGPGSFAVENGLLKTIGGMGLLYWTGGPIGNCKIHVVYRCEHFNDNSGVFIRIPVEPKEPWMPVWYGYEVQIDNHPETSGEDDHHITGTLYSLTTPMAKPGKPGPQWNIMDIELDRARTRVLVDGELVTDYTEGQPVAERKFNYEPIHGSRPEFGWIGLQNDSSKSTVYFKEISVEETSTSKPPCEPK